MAGRQCVGNYGKWFSIGIAIQKRIEPIIAKLVAQCPADLTKQCVACQRRTEGAKRLKSKAIGLHWVPELLPGALERFDGIQARLTVGAVNFQTNEFDFPITARA